MKKHSDDFSGRLSFVGVILFLVAGALIYRLFYLQVIKADYFSNEANYQYAASQVKSPINNRGTIYFREKSGQLISAALVKEGYKAVINPSVLKNPEDVYEKISSVISIDRETFLRRAEKKNDAYEEVGRYLDSDKAKFIQDLVIPGLSVVVDQWRFYPGGKLASHVLGFVGYRGDDMVGQYGVEKSYEEYLRGENENIGQNYFIETLLNLGKGIFVDLFEKKDVVLTIEPSVEGFLEAALEKIYQNYSAESAGGIILEPKTGKILALAARPDFDPNFYGKVENPALFLNPLVSNIFEVGSVFKPLTLSAALDQNKITPQTTYYDGGYLEIDGARIENFDAKGRGRVDMQAVLDESLNTGAVFAMRQLGRENFKNYLLSFGLAEKTGVDLPDEVRGNVNDLDTPREIEYATASFGQGIAVTPLEFAAAFATLANGGLLMEPYIIEKDQPVIKRQVIKKETSEEITRMLVKVVDEALLGGSVKNKRYSVAAKTGTAQIPLENQKGYSEDYLHTFIGYAPAYDAKFLVFLYLKKPQGVKYASQSLTSSFMDITKFLINYYEVPPDR